MPGKNDFAIRQTSGYGVAPELSFGGVTSFLRRPYTKDLTGADVAVSGIPFDCATTSRPGTRLGPRQIREMSALLPWEPPFDWKVNPYDTLAIVDYGDCAFDHALVSAIPQAITDHVRGILAHDAVPITLGGDHYITYPILKAIAEKHGPVAIIQFDAHSDIWPDYNPDRIDHGTMMYRAVKDGLVDTARSAMVGIRTTIEDPLGVTILDSLWVHEHGPKAAVERLRQIVGNGPVYVTFDIDGLDPAFAPGTGTPVFGGLTSGQVDLILRGLAGIDIIGGDVVEVSPPFDTTGATAVAGATIALNLICLLAARRGGARIG